MWKIINLVNNFNTEKDEIALDNLILQQDEKIKFLGEIRKLVIEDRDKNL